ncbi:hypothetical protein H6G04_09180 [Calothrix membranacea FACHB-236]|nr:hypothetical protein [Calothrix membranacea FACHB-236]
MSIFPSLSTSSALYQNTVQLTKLIDNKTKKLIPQGGIQNSKFVFSQRERLRQGKFAQVEKPAHATFRKIHPL